MTARTPVEYRGIKYPSLTAAGRKYGLGYDTVKRRLSLGHPLELRNTGVLRSSTPLGSFGAKEGAPLLPNPNTQRR